MLKPYVARTRALPGGGYKDRGALLLRLVTIDDLVASRGRGAQKVLQKGIRGDARVSLVLLGQTGGKEPPELVHGTSRLTSTESRWASSIMVFFRACGRLPPLLYVFELCLV